MNIKPSDKKVLRELAKHYSEIAHLDIQKERIERYYKTNSLEDVKPVVLISEVPWGEFNDESLQCVCSPEMRWTEFLMRRAIYQWKHFQGDMVVPPVIQVAKAIKHLRGIGLEVQEEQIKSTTGTGISAHAYKDQLKTEDDLAKLTEPEIVYDQEKTEENLAKAHEVYDGLMEVELIGGGGMHAFIWDDIARYRGVDALLMDLAMRPEFMHKVARRFMEITKSRFDQMEKQGLLHPMSYYLHYTASCARDLPAGDFAGNVRKKDVWGRCAAQIFCSVSPEMHDEFDLKYNQELFGDCGLLYYGCCEPLDKKVDILRKRFKNLRKISITPWADPMVAAENMGSDYVMAAKPNPALVANTTFDPEPVKKEIAGYCEAAKKHGTTLEFVLKDISTVSKNPNHLTQWVEAAMEVVDQYYG